MKYKYPTIKPIIPIAILVLSIIGICNAYSQYEDQGWERLADMPTARAGPESCLLDGKIYVIGGVKLSNDVGYRFASNEVYDTLLDEWTILANLQEARVGHTINLVDGIIYAIGSWETTTSEAYNPQEDTWTYINSLPGEWWNHSSCVINDTIYIFGNATYGIRNAARIYVPAIDTWDTIPSMKYPRFLSSCCVYNNKIIVFGGTDGIGIGKPSKRVEVYDPIKYTWEELTDIPVVSFTHITIEYNNKIYLFGGDNGESEINPLSHVFEYNPETDKWREMEDMPFVRSYMAGTKAGKYLYLFGGFDEQSRENPLNEVWRFNLDLVKVKEPTSIYQTTENSFVFHEVYPNPFSESTRISYELTEPGEVQMEIFNIIGEKITILANENQNPGDYQVTWNAEGVHPGIYFCRLKVAGFEKVSKLIVSR